jgi:hypothetical protein
MATRPDERIYPDHLGTHALTLGHIAVSKMGAAARRRVGKPDAVFLKTAEITDILLKIFGYRYKML